MTNDKRLNKFAKKYIDKEKQKYSWQLRTARAVVKDIDYLEETCRRLQDNEYLDFIVVPSRKNYISYILWERWYLEIWRYCPKDSREDRLVEFIILFEITNKIIDIISTGVDILNNEELAEWCCIYEKYTDNNLSSDIPYFISSSRQIEKVVDKLIELEE